MSETSLKPVIDKLENLFSKFNEKFYGGELQKAIITVSPDTTKGGCIIRATKEVHVICGDCNVEFEEAE